MSKMLIFATLGCLVSAGTYFHGWRNGEGRGDMMMGIGMLLLAMSLVVSQTDAMNGWASAWISAAGGVAILVGAALAIRRTAKAR